MREYAGICAKICAKYALQEKNEENFSKSHLTLFDKFDKSLHMFGSLTPNLDNIYDQIILQPNFEEENGKN